MTIPLSRPDLGAPERAYVQEVLGSGRLALGPYAKQFEEHMAARCGTAHAVAVSSGTAALHLMLRALGVGPGHVVLTTPFSFVASANVALYVGATPRFVDIDPATYLLDPDRVAQALTPDVRALLPVDVFGRPADWPALTALAAAHDLLLIDDACEALGATVDGVPIGRWGHGAAFGFYPNKQITLGEGGCITTDDAALAAHCRSLRNQGRATDQRMEHVELGYNYRLSELSAAVGCGQLERLDDLLARRMEVAHRYEMLLADLHDDLI
ncbi:MAG: DegT/DnrJ/EryC1/StrS aminotransferase family protein, partial [Bacteroidota bacterium]